MGKLPGIGLNSQERKVRRRKDRFCKRERLLRRCNATAPHADFVFNKAMDGGAEGGSRRFQSANVFKRIHADGKPAAAGKVAKAHELCGLHHLICNEHILHAGLDQVFRFAQLCAGNPLCAACKLHMGNGGAFVGFIVRAKRHAERTQQIHRAGLIPFKHIKIDDEGRGFQL